MGNIFLLLAIIVQGAGGIVGQLIILRELPAVHYGNELIFGIILTTWLFWNSIGSFLLGHIARKIKQPLSVYVFFSLLGLIMLIITIIVIRYLRPLFGIIPGEITSLPFVLGTCFMIVSPYAFIQGILFSSGACVLAHKNPSKDSIHSVYILEALGAVIGGVYAYIWGIRFLDTFQNIGLINIVYLIILWGVLYHSTIRKKWWYGGIIILCMMLNICGLLFPRINTFFYQKAYAPLPVIDNTHSPYGELIITQQDKNSLTFFENGLQLFSTNDILSHEEATQFALLAHPHPIDILLLGGGANGCLSDIMQQESITNITYVELDPLLVTKAEQYLPRNEVHMLKDPRVHIYYGDARHFIKSTPESFDVIISQLPEPFTLQLSRFYSQEFFRLVHGHLREGGIFSFTVNSSENYISPTQALFLKTLANTLHTVFSSVALIPGSNTIYLARKKEMLPSISSTFFIRRAEERSLTLRYINKFFLPTRLSFDKIAYLRKRLQETSAEHYTSDFKPLSFYYSLLLWSDMMYRPLKNFIHTLLSLPWWVFYGIGTCLFLMVSFLVKNKRTYLERGLILSIGTVGLTEISLEIIILFLVQIFLGNIYLTTGIIISSYMAGLTVGALHGKQFIKHNTHTEHIQKAVLWCQGVMILIPLSIGTGASLMHTSSIQGTLLYTIFIGATFCIGSIGGTQFLLVYTAYQTQTNTPNKSFMYAVDLCGSSVGALFVSTFIIPLLGIQQSLVLLAFLNTLCFLYLLGGIKQNAQHRLPVRA